MSNSTTRGSCRSASSGSCSSLPQPWSSTTLRWAATSLSWPLASSSAASSSRLLSPWVLAPATSSVARLKAAPNAPASTASHPRPPHPPVPVILSSISESFARLPHPLTHKPLEVFVVHVTGEDLMVLIHPIDEFVFQGLVEYVSKVFQRVDHGGLPDGGIGNSL